jgi:hypothetical protein
VLILSLSFSSSSSFFFSISFLEMATQAVDFDWEDDTGGDDAPVSAGAGLQPVRKRREMGREGREGREG